MKARKIYTKVEIKKAVDNAAVSEKTLVCLKRLAAYEPALATHFAVTKPKDKTDIWSVNSVIRDEFIEGASVVIDIRKGVTAPEAIVALIHIQEIIKNAQKAAKKKGDKKKKLVKNMNKVSWNARVCAIPARLFNIPWVVINYLINLFKI